MLDMSFRKGRDSNPQLLVGKTYAVYTGPGNLTRELETDYGEEVYAGELQPYVTYVNFCIHERQIVRIFQRFCFFSTLPILGFESRPEHSTNAKPQTTTLPLYHTKSSSYYCN